MSILLSWGVGPGKCKKLLYKACVVHCFFVVLMCTYINLIIVTKYDCALVKF